MDQAGSKMSNATGSWIDLSVWTNHWQLSFDRGTLDFYLGNQLEVDE